MRRFLHVLAVAALVLAPWTGSSRATTGSDQDAAIAAAREWLALIDSGRVSESWQASAELFRELRTEQQWAATVRAIRKPLGEVVKRRLLRVQIRESLPDAPDGLYVVIEYGTDYERRPGAVEIITPTLEGGAWRVSDYDIR